MPTPDSDETELIGCSIMGPKHENGELPCQDAWDHHQLPDGRVIIAVGDGVGSASLSHFGASVATETAANRLKEVFADLDSIDRTRSEWIFQQAFDAARRAVVSEARARDVDLPELDTTLHAVVAGPTGIAGAGVGDGCTVYGDGERYTKLYPREEEIAEIDAPHKTHPLTLSNWKPYYRFGYSETGHCVAAFSDGLSAWTWDGLEANSDFFASALGILDDAEDLTAADQRLEDALRNDNFRQSRDDKTFALARWAPQSLATADSEADTSESDDLESSESAVPSAGGGAAPATQQTGSVDADDPTATTDTGAAPATDSAEPADSAETDHSTDTTDIGESADSDVASTRTDRRDVPVVDVIVDHKIVLVLALSDDERGTVILKRPHILTPRWRLNRLLDAYDLELDSINELVGQQVPAKVIDRANRTKVRLDWPALKKASDGPTVLSATFTTTEL